MMVYFILSFVILVITGDSLLRLYCIVQNFDIENFDVFDAFQLHQNLTCQTF